MAFLAGAFLVTPAGLLPLVAVAFLGPLFAPVLALVRFLGAVGSGTVGKTLGREFPIYIWFSWVLRRYAPRMPNSCNMEFEGCEEYRPVAERVPSRAMVSCKRISINVRGRGGESVGANGGRVLDRCDGEVRSMLTVESDSAGEWIRELGCYCRGRQLDKEMAFGSDLAWVVECCCDK